MTVHKEDANGEERIANGGFYATREASHLRAACAQSQAQRFVAQNVGAVFDAASLSPTGVRCGCRFGGAPTGEERSAA